MSIIWKSHRTYRDGREQEFFSSCFFFWYLPPIVVFDHSVECGYSIFRIHSTQGDSIRWAHGHVVVRIRISDSIVIHYQFFGQIWICSIGWLFGRQMGIQRCLRVLFGAAHGFDPALCLSSVLRYRSDAIRPPDSFGTFGFPLVIRLFCRFVIFVGPFVISKIGFEIS